jgi:hypothetical protein
MTCQGPGRSFSGSSSPARTYHDCRRLYPHHYPGNSCPGGQDPSAESDKAAVRNCIDPNQLLHLQPTHMDAVPSAPAKQHPCRRVVDTVSVELPTRHLVVGLSVKVAGMSGRMNG